MFSLPHFKKKNNQPKEIIKEQPVYEHPLDHKFFTEMLKYEIDLSSRKFTYSTIESVVLLYAKAIEYYDSIKDPISLYFQEKIQLTLASKESLKMILHTEMNQDANEAPNQKKEFDYSRLDSTIVQKEKDKKEDGSDSDEEAMEDLANSANITKNRLTSYSISKVRADRAKEVNRYIKVETQKITAKKNIATLLDEYIKLAVANDKITRKNLDNQLNEIKQRLQKRKVEELIEKSMNTTLDTGKRYLDNELFMNKSEKYNILDPSILSNQFLMLS